MNKEILSIVESIENKKLLSREEIFKILEFALSIATKKKYPYDIDVRISINRQNGDFHTFRRWLIVLYVTKPTREITLEAAQFENRYVRINDYIEDQIDSVMLNRFTTQIIKQEIIKKIREIEMKKILDNIYHYPNQIVTGIVTSIKKKYIILNLNDHIEVMMQDKDMIPKEHLKLGDRIKGILYHEHIPKKGIQLFISRSKPEILFELFKIEIPEVKEKVVQIKAVARHTGFRSKVAVISYDHCIDPIGACIGIRGTRIQAISKEIFDERIDIILWNNNPAQFVINAMAPANVIDIIVHEDSYTMDILVDTSYLSQAIGRHGQNVRLASKLSGWKLNILTVEEFKKKNTIKMRKIYNLFFKCLQLQKYIINILIKEGFSSLEELFYISDNVLLKIQDININIVLWIRKKLKKIFFNSLN
ncbi:transcription termination factor NusA [Buchnera aphidicola]|uniref:Transcription termination/antitermination protein NusA n=1 Tax=Buchnera aphidicola (Stegophylla sp.) TaxID=2315800 RepID=A0A4D6YEH4_9GAMM|nr:transcription termination factor NusA [Buchnera aphidicola (Stegophylla sp.)]QCI26403.1 transcription termination/antitermination protein NusA [Buchnera aphidicola (Stegophylla sp.)]